MERDCHRRVDSPNVKHNWTVIAERRIIERARGRHYTWRMLRGRLVVITRTIRYLNRQHIRSRAIDVNRGAVTGIPRCIAVANEDVCHRTTSRIHDDSISAARTVARNITAINECLLTPGRRISCLSSLRRAKRRMVTALGSYPFWQGVARASNAMRSPTAISSDHFPRVNQR